MKTEKLIEKLEKLTGKKISLKESLVFKRLDNN